MNGWNDLKKDGPAAKGKSSPKSRKEWASYKKYAKMLIGRDL